MHTLQDVLREQIIFSAIVWHVKENERIRNSQNGFMKHKSYLASLISFYDRVTLLVDQGKVVNIVSLDFS